MRPNGTERERAFLGERGVERGRIALELAVNLQLTGPDVGLLAPRSGAIARPACSSALQNRLTYVPYVRSLRTDGT